MSSVLVTAASSFLGAHIIDQLLSAGYKVRGISRPAKADRVAAAYASFGNKFEVVVVDDIASSDLSAAFKDVSALVHVASPMPLNADAETTLRTAVEGTRRVLDFAYKNNVKKAVITSSVNTLYPPEELFKNVTYNEHSWSPLTCEIALAPDTHPMVAYNASKILAEKEVWKYAQEHPDMDFTTILPSFVYGPFSPHALLEDSMLSAGSNGLLYRLISGPEGRPHDGQLGVAYPAFINVKDAARAHVLALQAPPSSATPKRVIVSGGEFWFSDAVKLLQKERPALKHRLPDLSAGPEDPKESFKLDTSTGAKLGLTEYVSWEETVLEAVDDLVAKEIALKAKKESS